MRWIETVSGFLRHFMDGEQNPGMNVRYQYEELRLNRINLIY